MVYDPQSERRRPQPSSEDPVPVDALLDGNSVALTGGRGSPPGPTPEDPPPPVSVTPQPADPWSDRLLLIASSVAVVAAIIALVIVRWLWLRRRE